MGGMIVQRLAIEHPERLLSLTSAMSRTGEPQYGQSTPEALAILQAKPASRAPNTSPTTSPRMRVYGSKPDGSTTSGRARGGAAYDRCFYPEGVGRQMMAIMSDGSRADALRPVRVPTLVLHGSRDTLIDPTGGRRTAEVIPGARYVEIEGMGHDYPPVVWDTWVDTWLAFVTGVVVVGVVPGPVDMAVAHRTVPVRVLVDQVDAEQQLVVREDRRRARLRRRSGASSENTTQRSASTGKRVEIVRREHDRLAGARRARRSAPSSHCWVRGIERGGRLVEQQHLGIHREHRRDRDPLLLAARELVRRAVGEVGDAEHRQRVVDPRVRPVRAAGPC